MFEYSKSYEKGKSKGKKGKGKGQGKEERPPPNSSFAGHCRLCGNWDTERTSAGKVISGNGGSSEFFLEFDSAERSGHYVGGCEDGSCHSRG